MSLATLPPAVKTKRCQSHKRRPSPDAGGILFVEGCGIHPSLFGRVIALFSAGPTPPLTPPGHEIFTAAKAEAVAKHPAEIHDCQRIEKDKNT
jgi:hypothetical protein